MQPAYQAWAEDRDLPIAGAGRAPNHDVSRDPAYGYADPKKALAPAHGPKWEAGAMSRQVSMKSVEPRLFSPILRAVIKTGLLTTATRGYKTNRADNAWHSATHTGTGRLAARVIIILRQPGRPRRHEIENPDP